jgi:hypothetical protein
MGDVMQRNNCKVSAFHLLPKNAKCSMYKFDPSRRNRILLMALLALAVFAIFRMFSDHTNEDEYLFVIDARADKAAPLDLSRVFTKDEEKRTKLRIIVQVITSSQLMATETAILQAFGERHRSEQSTRQPLWKIAEREKKDLRELKRKVPSSDLFFITLDLPSTDSKKALRAAIDVQDRFRGDDRVVLLESIVPVLRPEPYALPGGCEQMKDDFAYLKWNFYGVGLIVDEAAITLLKLCKPFG